jgi:hypothetical protein
MSVHKRAKAQQITFAGILFNYIDLLWHTDAPGYTCAAEDMPGTLKRYFGSVLSEDELRVFGKNSCGPNCKESDNSCTLEIALDVASGGFTSRVVCKDWAKVHLPDLYYQLFPEEKIVWIKLDLRKPLERTGPINAYGLTQGETADENLQLLSEQIGKQFVRELALARRVSISEILKKVEVQEETIEIFGRGDAIPWWVRKGYTEMPLD